MQQWNADWSDEILKKMAAILVDWDIIYLTEVSSTAPITMFCKIYLPNYTSKDLIPMPTKTERSSGSLPQKYGAVLFNTTKLMGALVEVDQIVPKQDLDSFNRYPFTFLFEIINDAFKTVKTPRKFLISGIHGSTGLLSSSNANNFIGDLKMRQEISALTSFVDYAKKNDSTAIFIGDFNMKLYYVSEKKDTAVLEAITKIADGKYEHLIGEKEVGTMASWKYTHINDNIIVPKTEKKKFVAGVLTPFQAYPLEGTEYMMCRDVDVDRLTIPMFTDHWPVVTYYKL